MHTQFTTYHTIAIIIITVLVLFVLSKLVHLDIKTAFKAPALLTLLAVSLVITGLSLWHYQQYYSGMNLMKVHGFPRGFYQTLTEPGDAPKKIIVYRYALKNILVWFCICATLYYLIKLALAKK